MSTPAPGEPFNPWHGVCGFFPQDVVGRQRKMANTAGTIEMITDGQKRLYERLVRFAGTDGRCFPSQTTLARELGKSERQVRKDLVKLEQFRLIRHLWHEGRRSNTYEFLWHRIFDERNASAAQDREAVERERNSASVQRKAELTATIIDRNQDSGQLRNLSGTGANLNGTLHPVERHTGSANIIKDRDLEKASNGGGAPTGFSEGSDDDQSQPPAVMAANGADRAGLPVL